jgi:hypothetical protein
MQNQYIKHYLLTLKEQNKSMNPIKGTVNWGIIGCGNVCEVKKRACV